MSELEFPVLEDPAPAQAPSSAVATHAGEIDLAKIDLQAVALSAFTPARAAIATAHAKLTGVVHDLSTPTKLADAKSLRHRLINIPLAESRKTSTALKSKLTAVSKAVGAELVAIEADFEAADQLIKPAIEAREAEVAEEKRIAAEKEEARQQKHRDALAALARPAERAAEPGMTAERIANGIELVKAIVIDRAAWEEFADRAEDQKAVTLERMQALHATAVAAEAEALRLAAEKAEQERRAAELKAQEEALAAERAEIERQKAELQAAKDRVAAEAQAKADEAARVEAEAQARHAERLAAVEAAKQQQAQRDADAQQRALERDSATNTPEQIVQPVLKAEAHTPDATDRDDAASTSPSVGSMGAGQPADAGPVAGAKPVITIELEQAEPFVPPVVETPTLSLGEIKTRIVPLSITAEGLAELGYPATKVKAACMYRESDWLDIKAALRKLLD